MPAQPLAVDYRQEAAPLQILPKMPLLSSHQLSWNTTAGEGFTVRVEGSAPIPPCAEALGFLGGFRLEPLTSTISAGIESSYCHFKLMNAASISVGFDENRYY